MQNNSVGTLLKTCPDLKIYVCIVLKKYPLERIKFVAINLFSVCWSAIDLPRAMSMPPDR